MRSKLSEFDYIKFKVTHIQVITDYEVNICKIQIMHHPLADVMPNFNPLELTSVSRQIIVSLSIHYFIAILEHEDPNAIPC